MGLDSGRQENWFGYDVPVEDDFDIAGDASPEEFWDNDWASDSCCYPDRTGDLRSVTKISDFYSARQWHSTGMYRDTLRPAGFEHQLALCPPWPPENRRAGQTVRLLFSRGPGLDFSERDRAVLTLLRPHLHQAYLDAERRRRGMPQLTRASGRCCAWSPTGTPTPRSPTGLACPREPCASTCRTSTSGCRYRAAPRQSPAHSRPHHYVSRGRRATVRSAAPAHNVRSTYLPVERIAFLPWRQIGG